MVIGRVLLVGGTGFIGRHILQHLLDAGADVAVLSRFSRGEHDIPGLRECTFIKGDIAAPEIQRTVREGGMSSSMSAAPLNKVTMNALGKVPSSSTSPTSLGLSRSCRVAFGDSSRANLLWSTAAIPFRIERTCEKLR